MCKHSLVFTVKTLDTSGIFLERPWLFTSRLRPKRAWFSAPQTSCHAAVYKDYLDDAVERQPLNGVSLLLCHALSLNPEPEPKQLPFQERMRRFSLKSLKERLSNQDSGLQQSLIFPIIQLRVVLPEVEDGEDS